MDLNQDALDEARVSHAEVLMEFNGEGAVEIGRDVWAVADTARKALAQERIPSRMRETQDLRRGRTLHAIVVPESWAELAREAADGLL